MPNFYFFDSKLVVQTVDKGVRKALSKFGAYVMTTARRSLRKATKTKPISKPGEPPRMHIGTPKRRLFFAYDPNTKSVVVGSEKTKEGLVLRTLEYGGLTNVQVQKPRAITFKVGDIGCIRVRDPNAKLAKNRFYWTRLTTQAQADRATKLYLGFVNQALNTGKTVRRKIKARPYMRPAFRKNLTQARLTQCFANCIK